MAQQFELTKDRSTVNGKYLFEFIGNSQNAVVPVLQRYQTGEYRIIGTASYFLRPNLFLTAAHIFEGDDINADDAFYTVLEGEPEPVHFSQHFCHETIDVSILVLDAGPRRIFDNVHPLAVMDCELADGEIVAVFGYSHSHVDPNDIIELIDGGAVQNVRLRSKWELGGVLESHENGCRLVKGKCYETSVLAEGRDSGAPMFNSNGFLAGIMSYSGSYDDGLPNSICTSILPLRDIPINGVATKDQWLTKDRGAHCRRTKC